MAELNFKNLCIKYDNTKISKSSIRKNNAIENIGVVCITIGIIAIALYSMLIEYNLHALLFDIVSIFLLIGGGLFAIYKIQQKITPKYFDLVTQLMKFKHNEIEVGWFNNRIIIESFNRIWAIYDFEEFIGCECTLVDKSDRIKPIFITIDLTLEKPEILISNIKE